MSKDCDSQDECIDLDLEWVKGELKGLTRAERCLILEEYLNKVQSFGVGMKEYRAFVKVFNEMEDK